MKINEMEKETLRISNMRNTANEQLKNKEKDLKKLQTDVKSYKEKYEGVQENDMLKRNNNNINTLVEQLMLTRTTAPTPDKKDSNKNNITEKTNAQSKSNENEDNHLL